MDSDDKKITQLTQVTTLSDSDLFVIAIDVGTAPKTRAIKKSDAFDGLGGGGLTTVLASITTADLTATAGQRDSLDVSGMTANRNWVLPSGGAVGDEVEVALRVGNDTYALIIIGDTGVTITAAGVTAAAATEWSRLFITGESLKFVKTSTTNWQLVHDGRIPCVAILERQAAQSIKSATTTKIALDTINTNRGGMGDITTNDRVNIRRTNIYQVVAFVAMRVDNQEYVEADLYKDGALFKFQRTFVSTSGSNQYASPEAAARGTYAAGTYFELYVTHTEGAAENTDTTYYPTLAVIEVL